MYLSVGKENFGLPRNSSPLFPRRPFSGRNPVSDFSGRNPVFDLEAVDDRAGRPLGELEGRQVEAGMDLSVLPDESVVLGHVEDAFPDPAGNRFQARAVTINGLNSGKLK